MDEFDFAYQLAREAGSLLLKYYQAFGIQADYKTDRSLVTKADLAVDQLISQKIAVAYPSDAILSEELHSRTPDEAVINHSAVWVIDPLDGTTNFSLGLPVWGTLITRLREGYPELTAMNFPLLGEMYTAHRGQGAWMNGTRLDIRSGSSRGTQPFFACCSRTFRRYSVSVPYKTRILGSSAYTFNLVARGAAIAGFEATPKIWDLAGSWLLVNEAGGRIESFHEDQPFPIQASINYVTANYPTLAAASSQVAEQVRRQIIPKETG